jgi:uncharacterized protein (DUF697 family)/predicted GTPase
MDFDRAKASLNQSLEHLRQKLPTKPFDHLPKPHLPKTKLSLPQLRLPKLNSKPGMPSVDDLMGWFSLDEGQLNKILQQVRSSLPTTEVIAIGKPQSGKSSIVRAITGVSADIIGQGYRPHTSHTLRYNFPDEELPLLVFTDTVGLGDGQSETSEVVKELLQDAAVQTSNAKVMLLTVKITDFATDTLVQIGKSLRSQHPEIPCLLAVTCLHEVYPASQGDHPENPGDLPQIKRAFEQIQTDFAGLFDRALLIDFTLEGDGYSPQFYGLEGLSQALGELLPKAEAEAVVKLLNDRDTEEIGNLYRTTAHRYILPFAIMSGALAAVPLPLATMPVLTAVQVSMVVLLGRLYGQTLTPSQAGGVVSAIAGGFVAQAIGRELVKFIPGFGAVVAASWATAYTVSLGKAATVYFGDLVGKPDGDRIQSVMQESSSEIQGKMMGDRR